jgi:hypothetical protein
MGRIQLKRRRDPAKTFSSCISLGKIRVGVANKKCALHVYTRRAAAPACASKGASLRGARFH